MSTSFLYSNQQLQRWIDYRLKYSSLSTVLAYIVVFSLKKKDKENIILQELTTTKTKTTTTTTTTEIQTTYGHTSNISKWIHSQYVLLWKISLYSLRCMFCISKHDYEIGLILSFFFYFGINKVSFTIVEHFVTMTVLCMDTWKSCFLRERS